MNTVTKISKSHFSFTLKSYGRYFVIYTSPKTNIQYCSDVTDMTIIDAVKNTDTPMVKDLIELKRYCKHAYGN